MGLFRKGVQRLLCLLLLEVFTFRIRMFDLRKTIRQILTIKFWC